MGDTIVLGSGIGGLALHLGFDGDIAAASTMAANVWVCESDDIGRVWQAPADEDVSGLFVSFPLLKDPGPPCLDTPLDPVTPRVGAGENGP